MGLAAAASRKVFRIVALGTGGFATKAICRRKGSHEPVQKVPSINCRAPTLLLHSREDQFSRSARAAATPLRAAPTAPPPPPAPSPPARTARLLLLVRAQPAPAGHPRRRGLRRPPPPASSSSSDAQPPRPRDARRLVTARAAPLAAARDRADSDSENNRPDPEDPELNSIQRRVKKWALKKMAMQFNDYKKKLDNFFVKKKKTPDFNGPYEKIKDHWEAFVKFKTSERAKTRLDTNKKNAANKMYFHTMGRGGYKAGRPKWEKWENDLIAKWVQPEIEEVAFDATGQGSQRKSSVASTELPGDDADVDPQMAPPSPVDPQMPPDLYPVDFITESTPCELHFQTMGYLTLKAAIGYVLPPVPDQRYQFNPVPPGYAVAGWIKLWMGMGR
ncbi:hypothetical protein QYE76_071283 [Lolium multiflorum]|uniref:Uncharacterized protein n=1 Tax=Lolium multiflorum TaxID=4521 RepID=A0AAD8WER6_LOLMU|nr:hypothetical protein QYE76_071283 [Lolium multiflorum]